jgi:single-strand DNA-binding protein
MNIVSLTGRLTRDPELQERGGKTVCDLRIAVDNGQYEPTYVDVSTFDGQAEACAKYLAKGRQVAVDGRLVYREWEAEDGSKRSRHSVVGRVEFLDRKRESEPEGADAASKEGDGDF